VLGAGAGKAGRDGVTRPRLAVVSAADPVDRVSGRMVHLPDAPFLLGDLDPARILAPRVDGPVVVDNDVNWAARAERDHARAVGGSAAALDDFVYLFLGEGVGYAVVSDGQVRRGHSGLAGGPSARPSRASSRPPWRSGIPSSSSSAVPGAAIMWCWMPSPVPRRVSPGSFRSGGRRLPTTPRWRACGPTRSDASGRRLSLLPVQAEPGPR